VLGRTYGESFTISRSRHKSPVAAEALQALGAVCHRKRNPWTFYQTSGVKFATRVSRPLLESLKQWFEETFRETPRKIRYGSGRSLRTRTVARCCASVMTAAIEIDNNAAERALPGSWLWAKEFLFAARWGGGKCRGDYSLLGTAKLNGIDPKVIYGNVLSPHCGSSDQTHRGVATLNVAASLNSPTRGGIEEAPPRTFPPTVSQSSLHRRDNRKRWIRHRSHSSATECVAVAHEGKNTLAMLKREKVILWHVVVPSGSAKPGSDRRHFYRRDQPAGKIASAPSSCNPFGHMTARSEPSGR